MKIKCEYCDSYMTELDENCPNCGAGNPQYGRASVQTPRTIEELQQWYVDHNLPPKEVTRFFIGENYQGKRAFGIYQDGERFIVYKNKDDGSRAIRYDGSDEAYAVNELYLKLKERIAEEKARNNAMRSGGKKNSKNKKASMAQTLLISAAFVIGISLISNRLIANRGYYQYGGQQYYYLDNWYVYDTYSNDWTSTEVDKELSNHWSDYFESEDYNYSYGTSDFENSSYYEYWEENRSNDSNWDSDSSWSSDDSWDSGGGDWGSDW